MTAETAVNKGWDDVEEDDDSSGVSSSPFDVGGDKLHVALNYVVVRERLMAVRFTKVHVYES